MSPSASSQMFATIMVVAPTSFFLGILFSLFPYDYPLLWSNNLLTSAHLDATESHLRLLHAAPNLIVRMMHIVTGIGLLGLIFKLYKPTESNMLFDGGSLVLYMIAIIIYLTNIVKGLRIVTVGTYGLVVESAINAMDDPNGLANQPEEEGVVGREDNLKVLAASNTIAALVLVGVLVLQIGQWYADRVEAKLREKHGKMLAEASGVEHVSSEQQSPLQQTASQTGKTGAEEKTTTTATSSSKKESKKSR